MDGKAWGGSHRARRCCGLRRAALLAVTRGAAGIYNVAEGDDVVDTSKARCELGFDPNFRLPAACRIKWRADSSTKCKV